MDIVSFFGRFHPLVVHLPIGILLAAILIAFLSRKEKFRFLAPALDFLLLLGAISAALACILGLMLAQGGDYDSNSLFWHQWSGIFLAVQIGRASCRARVCKYVYISVVADYLK